MCLTYQKVHPFAKHPQEWPLAMFSARLTQNQIVMEHVNFWFSLSYVSFIFLIRSFNKTYISQMCDVNNVSLTIGAMKTYIFHVIGYTESCKDPLK